MIFDPNATPQFQTLTRAKYLIPWYPFAYQLTSGKVFVAGSQWFNAPDGVNSQLLWGTLNLATSVWEQAVETTEPIGGTAAIKGGSAVMYGPSRIMKAGGNLASFQECGGFELTD